MDFSGRRLSGACYCAARRNRRKSARPFSTKTQAHRPATAPSEFIFDHRRHQLAVRAPAQEPDLPRTRVAGRRGGGSVHAQSGRHRGRAQKIGGLYRPVGSTRPARKPPAICISSIPLTTVVQLPIHHPPLAKRILAIDRPSTASSRISIPCPGKPMEFRRRNNTIAFTKKASSAHGEAKARGKLE